MLEGSPYEYLHKPILEYLAHGAKSILATECVQFYLLKKELKRELLGW